MRSALYRRVEQKYFAGSDIAASLAFHSGGYMRDLLRLVIECIYSCPEGEPISRTLAEMAIEQVRQSYLEGLEAQDEVLLQQVHRERDFPLDEENLQRMDALIQGYLMLRYQDQTPWYDAHPLLWPRLKIRVPTWEEIAAACP
jgi:hypothetical protein